MTALPDDWTPPPRSLLYVNPLPADQGGGLEIGCDCGTVTRRAVMTAPVIHLAMPGRSGVSACGRWSKHTTSSAEGVTCGKCRETWGFALAEHMCRDCSPWPKFPPGGLSITLHGMPPWGFRRHCDAESPS